MKLCKDCKWYEPDELDQEFGRCRSPRRRFSINRITGEKEYTFTCALTHRSGGWPWANILGFCGKSGRFFEAKRPLAND